MKKLLALGAAAVLFAGCSTTTTTTVEPTASPDAMTQSSPDTAYMSPDVTPSPVAAMDTTTTVTAPALMADGSMQVKLGEQNTSGQSGTATLTPTKDGKVTVVLALTGGKFTAAQPAHIHEGSCPTPGAVKYPLTNVVNGKSTTTLNVSMADLLKAAPKLSVNVHKSAAETSVYTACGDIQ